MCEEQFRDSSQQRLRQNGLELVAQGGGLALGLVEFGQQFHGVAVVVRDGVRVLEVEVIAARLHLIGSDPPCDFIFHPAPSLRTAPPVNAWLQMLDSDGLGHRVGFLAVGHAVLVKPDFLGRLALLKEQQVGADAGIGLEDAIGQADDGVEVALLHQVLFEPRLHAFAEERPVRQHHGGAALRLQEADDERQKEVGRLAGLEVLGKVALDAVFLTAAEGRIGENNVHAVDCV